MKTLILPLALALCSLGYAQSKKAIAPAPTKPQEAAKSGWQYTTWGMTSEEIVAASGGTVRILSGEELRLASGERHTALARGDYTSGPFAFEADFRADKGGTTLRAVRLKLKNPGQYGDLRAAMTSKYGLGDTSESSEYSDVVRWLTEDQLITLYRSKSVQLISLTYTERPRPTGL